LRLLLDTHALLWWLEGDSKLSAPGDRGDLGRPDQGAG
jgi:PIN domain nuclease of toxin-antitoxin system